MTLLYERPIEILAVIHLLILGGSHILKPDAWAEFFVQLAQKGRAGVFWHGFLSLWFGSIVVAFYRVWHDVGIVLTLFGWLLVAKAVHCFLFPEAALRSLQRVAPSNARRFIPVGVLYLALAATIAVRWWRSF